VSRLLERIRTEDGIAGLLDDGGSPRQSENDLQLKDCNFESVDEYGEQRWAQARKFTRSLPRPCQGWQQGLAMVDPCKHVSELNILART
jgi:hypothetical protein